MASVRAEAIGAALAAAATVAGEPVTYSRGPVTLSITGAMQGATNWDSEDPQPGVRLEERQADWLIELSQLDNSGEQWEPKHGDRITTEDGRTFRALPEGPNKRVFEFVDRGGRSWVRIHTKER